MSHGQVARIVDLRLILKYKFFQVDKSYEASLPAEASVTYISAVEMRIGLPSAVAEEQDSSASYSIRNARDGKLSISHHFSDIGD